MKIAGGSLIIQRGEWGQKLTDPLGPSRLGASAPSVDFRLLVDELGGWMTRLDWNGRMAGGGCDGSGSVLRRGGKVDTMEGVSGKNGKPEKSSEF